MRREKHNACGKAEDAGVTASVIPPGTPAPVRAESVSIDPPLQSLVSRMELLSGGHWLS